MKIETNGICNLKEFKKVSEIIKEKAKLKDIKNGRKEIKISLDYRITIIDFEYSEYEIEKIKISYPKGEIE